MACLLTLLLLLSLSFIALVTSAQSSIDVTSNATRTSKVLSGTATSNGRHCCQVGIMTVGLNYWWKETLTATAATILTQYLQYNNTVITNTTTIYDTGAIGKVTAPVEIIPSQGYMEYSDTIIATNTSAVFPFTTITSPTPYVEANILFRHNGTITIDASGKERCFETSDIPFEFRSFMLGTGFPFLEHPATVHTKPGYATPTGTQLLDYWISQTPSITDILPDIASCTVLGGSGQPTVHVPVTALTEHASTTILMGSILLEQSTPSVITASNSFIDSPSTPPLNTQSNTLPISTPNTSPDRPSTPRPSSQMNSFSNKYPSSISRSFVSQDSDPDDPALLPPTPVLVTIPVVSASNPSNAPLSAPFPVTLENGQVLSIQVPPKGSEANVILPGGETLHPGDHTVVGSQTIILPSNKNDGGTAHVDSYAPINAGTSFSAIQIIDATSAHAITLPTAQQQPSQQDLAGTQKLGGSSTSVLTLSPVAPSSSPGNSAGKPSAQGVVLPNGSTLAVGSTATIGDMTVAVISPQSTVGTDLVVSIWNNLKTQVTTLSVPTGSSSTGSTGYSGVSPSSTTSGGTVFFTSGVTSSFKISWWTGVTAALVFVAF